MYLLPGEDRCGHAHSLTAQVHLRAAHVVDFTRRGDNHWSCTHTYTFTDEFRQTLTQIWFPQRPQTGWNRSQESSGDAKSRLRSGIWFAVNAGGEKNWVFVWGWRRIVIAHCLLASDHSAANYPVSHSFYPTASYLCCFKETTYITQKNVFIVYVGLFQRGNTSFNMKLISRKKLLA